MSSLREALDVAIDRMTREHASEQEVRAAIHQIIADHEERPCR